MTIALDTMDNSSNGKVEDIQQTTKEMCIEQGADNDKDDMNESVDSLAKDLFLDCQPVDEPEISQETKEKAESIKLEANAFFKGLCWSFDVVS